MLRPSSPLGYGRKAGDPCHDRSMLGSLWLRSGPLGLPFRLAAKRHLEIQSCLFGVRNKFGNMDKLQPPSALALTGNLAEHWRRFKQQFEIYEIASGLARKDGNVRAMTLLHMAGSEALKVYNTFQWDEGDDNTKVDKIMEKFERCCNPRKNLTFELHYFFSRNQLEGESIDA